ncbi:MAG TPA: ComEC/Rec2 family competence protein, partial [Thermoanaerobaculia bacterium]|nr:ComEC/Rec2 family competence protein [Thermoanaerobaculia bacterium]
SPADVAREPGGRGRPPRQRTVTLCALLVPSVAAIALFLARREVDTPRILFCDVGQGDAIAIRWRDRAILIDGGPRAESIVPQLVDRGIHHLDAVVLTHAHPDHCGGLPAVIEQLGTEEVWISPRRFSGECAQQILASCLTTHTPIRILRATTTRDAGELQIETHLPTLTFRRSPENNASVVLRVHVAGRTILLTGDIEREAELWLADRDLRADVLKVAHHGSRSSTSETLLNAVQPRLAFISCGRRNLFGHPHQQVLDALDAHRVRTWRTDREGTLELEIRGGHLFVRPQFDTPN